MIGCDFCGGVAVDLIYLEDDDVGFPICYYLCQEHEKYTEVQLRELRGLHRKPNR